MLLPILYADLWFNSQQHLSLYEKNRQPSTFFEWNERTSDSYSLLLKKGLMQTDRLHSNRSLWYRRITRQPFSHQSQLYLRQTLRQIRSSSYNPSLSVDAHLFLPRRTLFWLAVGWSDDRLTVTADQINAAVRRLCSAKSVGDCEATSVLAIPCHWGLIQSLNSAGFCLCATAFFLH